MIADATTADRGVFARRFDVCIVGAGPAGITLARRLAAAGAEVALMEAGGRELEPRSQDLYRGEVVGLDYLDLAVDAVALSRRHHGALGRHVPRARCLRLRAAPLQSAQRLADRQGRPRPLCGRGARRSSRSPTWWPTATVTRTEARSGRARPPRPPRLPRLSLRPGPRRFPPYPFRYSPPVRFGDKYAGEIARSERINLWLNANLVDLRLSEDGTAVTAAVFRGYAPDDPGFTVRARIFCLCAGGIENARILLNARSQQPQGIGNRYDLVGRYFSDHPTFTLADVIYEKPMPARVAFYSPTPQFLDANAILNIGLRLYADRPSPLSLRRALWDSLACATPFTERLAARVLGRPAQCDQGGLASYWARWDGAGPLTGRVEAASEQALDPDSRVRLGSAVDVFGLQEAVLDWRLGALDTRTMRTAVTAFGMHLAEQGIGRLRIRDWLLADPPRFPRVGEDWVAGPHHMGTTRMAEDPRRGVVDRDCRVHGIGNFYIGGSSVFATGGHANPTYTIVQLALRLGDHLAGELRRGPMLATATLPEAPPPASPAVPSLSN